MTKGRVRRLFFLLCLCLGLGSFARPQSPPPISAKARAYLEEALGIMQKNSLGKKQVDWDALRREAFARAVGAEESVDTYEAIRFALGIAGNDHGFLQLTPQLLKREQDRHKVTNEAPAQVKRQPSPYASRRELEVIQHKIGNCEAPQMVVPLYTPPQDISQQGDAFASRLQKSIGELNARKPCGWIVDLRGNLGGNVFPMLAGIAPLLEEGNVAYALDADGGKTIFFYESGRAGVRNPDGSEVIIAKVGGVSPSVTKDVPIAILIDRDTASSGELIAVSFRGRGQTRFFGEPTRGVSTTTRGFRLSDGANMVLAIAVDVDRLGREYPDGVLPDERIPIGDRLPPVNEDPVVHAALGWLAEHNL